MLKMGKEKTEVDMGGEARSKADRELKSRRSGGETRWEINVEINKGSG